MSPAAEPGIQPPGCLGVLAIFGLLTLPVYFVLRTYVTLIRQSYGFERAPPDEEYPVRVCPNCHNTIMEDDFQHCPYCGTPLPEPETT